jgi:hypothetical protein
MAKLFRVVAIYYVEAETGEACKYISNDPSASMIEWEEIKDTSAIDDDWHDAYPFGGDGDLTCDEIAEAANG